MIPLHSSTRALPHVRETWGPALYAGLLGFFDGIVPGHRSMSSQTDWLLFGSLASFSDLRRRTQLAAPSAAALPV